MWGTLLTKSADLATWLLDLASTTIGVLLIAAALVGYVYTLFDRRIPRFVIPPVMCILFGAGCIILTHLHTQDAERRICEVKAQEQQQKLDALTMQAALDVKAVETKATEARLKLAHMQLQQALDLQAAIDDAKRADMEAAKQAQATADALNSKFDAATTANINNALTFNPILSEQADNVPAPIPKPVVLRSCLDERVPLGIVRALNKTASATSNTASSTVSER
ncbi:hypothetical protein EVC12_118 [Rhizobium phage RHph_I42]|nr:hypothetical protein EVC12_118 [Rhizobium phage RHph_I42]